MLLHAALVSLDAVQLLFERLQTQAAFILPMRIPFKFQKAVPGFDGVHHLAAIFHHNRFVEEHHGIVGSKLVGPAQIVKRGSAIILAASGRSAHVVGCAVIEQQAGRHRTGGKQAIQDVDGAVIVFFKHLSAGLQLEPMRVRRAIPRVCARFRRERRAAGPVRDRWCRRAGGAAGSRGETCAGHAQFNRPRLCIGLRQQLFGSSLVAATKELRSMQRTRTAAITPLNHAK